MSDLQNKLKHPIIVAEEFKQTANKESLQRRAGEDALETVSFSFLIFSFLSVRYVLAATVAY